MITNGFRAARLACGWSIRQLSEKSGVSPYIIRCCEEGDVDHVALYRLLALTDALGLYPTIALRPAAVARQRPRKHPPRNILESYMAYWELTLEGLALILNVSAQTVSVQCAKEHPAMKYIRLLAEEENMTVDSFLLMYGNLNIA